MPDIPVSVRHEPAAERYLLLVSGQPCGEAHYLEQGEQVVFTHTEVDPSLSGQGLGSALARGALEDVRRRGRRIVARCAFIADYLQRHEDWDDLVDPP